MQSDKDALAPLIACNLVLRTCIVKARHSAAANRMQTALPPLALLRAAFGNRRIYSAASPARCHRQGDVIVEGAGPAGGGHGELSLRPFNLNQRLAG
jgi:hypothetical protein